MSKIKTYHDLRRSQWESQPKDLNWHASDFKITALQPKKILFYKDLWHCPDLEAAKTTARLILSYPDVTYLELKGGRWIHVDYDEPPGSSYILPGQEEDKRKTYMGNL